MQVTKDICETFALCYAESNLTEDNLYKNIQRGEGHRNMTDQCDIRVNDKVPWKIEA